MKNTLLTVIGIGFIGFCAYFFLQNPANPRVQPLGTRYTEARFGDFVVKVEISDNPQTRERGLSKRKGLQPNAGMLFVFQDAGLYGFWMQDMKFGIDIIGLDAQKKIVWLEENLTPESYPKVFTPKSPVKYVFELPAGFIFNHRIDTDSLVSFGL